MAHSGLSRAQVMLQADQLFCALPLPLREASPPLCLFGKSTLPLGAWEQNVYLHHFGKAGEEGRELSHRKYWWKACGLFYMVALEGKSQWKEHFPQKPYIMELLQAGESKKQMAMNRQMYHRDKTWVGGCKEAEATGSSGRREKTHTMEPTYGKSGWDTEARTKWQETSSHKMWNQGRQENLLLGITAGD